jgi:hypothetical protein
MCVIAIQEYERAEEVPGDLRLWLGEDRLVNLVRNVVQDAPRPAATRNDSRGDENAAQRMLVMLTCCYAAGMFGSAEIEWASYSVPMLGAICGRSYPSDAAILRFRRINRHLIEECLADVLAAVWWSRPGGDKESFLSRRDELESWALSEARRRVQLAVVLDLGLSE